MVADELDVVPGEADLVPETPRVVPIRDCLALVGPELLPDPSYPIGQFEISGEGTADSISIAVAALSEVDGRVVVAVPFSAWHRTVARRVLPPSALQRPLPLTVDLVDRSLPEGAEASHFETAKIWIGILATDCEAAIVYDPETSEVSPDFQFSPTDPALTPSVEGLIQAFQQHFAFVSAASGGSGAEPKSSRGFDPKQFDHRLLCLEKSIESIAEHLTKLNVAPGAPTAVPLPSRPCAAGSTTTAAQQPEAAVPKAPAMQIPAGKAPIDSDVVQSARLAGVPEHQIQEMLKLALRGRSRLSDVPIQTKQNSTRRSINVLSESEEEEDPPTLPAAGSQEGDPIVTALSRLTEIATHLTLEKRKGRTLEALLDGAGWGGSSESGSASSTRKYSAALRALRNALSKQPEAVSKTIEKNMREDFCKVAQLPGSTEVPVSARAWLELRSRVQGFQTPVRFLWSVAGVLDCLINDRVSEARARCGLIMAMGDQMAIDRGSWIVASEIALEDPPPMAAFNSHTLPSEAEPPHTKLIDGRWLELFMAKLADVDSLNEKKKKLGNRRLPNPNSSEVDPPLVKAPGPKKNPKGKGEKGAGKGPDRAPAPEPQA